VIWNKRKNKTKKEEKSDCHQQSKPTNWVCNNTMVYFVGNLPEKTDKHPVTTATKHPLAKTKRPRRPSILQEVVNTLSAVKHLPERGLKSQWQQSIHWGRSKDAHSGKASTEGKGHCTLSSKASAREETSDNGSKASASENKDDQASLLRETMVAKYPLWKTDDDGKAKHCRIDHCEEEHMHTQSQGETPPGAWQDP
jgi:hypothetical protein